MGNVEVNLLNYKFQFRPLEWRQEFGIKFEPKKDRLRTILSHALTEVSGLPVSSVSDATKILEAIPSTVIYRIFIIYKGSLPPARAFTTVGLYRAPEPNRFIKHFEEAEEQEDTVADQAQRALEAKFGRKELQEAREIERVMMKNSGMRGATKATPDDAPLPAPPAQPRPDKGLGVRPPKPPSPPRQGLVVGEKQYVGTTKPKPPQSSPKGPVIAERQYVE